LPPACSALLLAACGGAEERIPARTADDLAARSDRVAIALARGDRCEADWLAEELVTAADAAADVPPDYRDELLVSARSLADRIDCPPPQRPLTTDEDDEDDDDDEGERGRGKGKGKKGKG
jgi:hypothetical protein